MKQDAEKVRQRRSRIIQILNVPQRVRFRSSLAAALLNGLFEHLAWRALLVSAVQARNVYVLTRPPPVLHDAPMMRRTVKQ